MGKERFLMDICIDFDGTCVTHDFPEVGRDIGAVPVLKELIANGHRLILWTMRSDVKNPVSNDKNIHAVGGQYLQDAINWFKQNDIPLYGIQTNPEQVTWTHSPKAYAKLYIDDCGLGCPLSTEGHSRPYVDWEKVKKMLIIRKLI